MNKQDELVLKKWKPVVDYSSSKIEETPKGIKLFLSHKLEEIEKYYIEKLSPPLGSSKFLKILIPIVRQNYGILKIIEDQEINGSMGIIVENVNTNHGFFDKIAIKYVPEPDITNCWCCCDEVMDFYIWKDEKWVRE